MLPELYFLDIKQMVSTCLEVTIKMSQVSSIPLVEGCIFEYLRFFHRF